MMTAPSPDQDLPVCSVSILTARCDIKFMQHTIPHLIRMCNYPFAERILHVDDPTIRGEYLSRPDIATAEEHLQICQQLMEQGVVDRVEQIKYDKTTIRSLAAKHFASRPGYTHDVHGYPIHGSAFAIEDSKTDYFVHFDCDMLLHSRPDFSWIKAGIELLEKDSKILFVSPRSGPPMPGNKLKQDDGVNYQHDAEAGCFRFKTFTSRKFLVSKSRLEQHLPVPLAYTSRRQRLKSLFSGKSPLWNWEVMISRHLNKKSLFRGDLDDSSAWTLHTPDHGQKFLEYLPRIIEKIEAGWFPESQAGDYDLRLENWIEDP